MKRGDRKDCCRAGINSTTENQNSTEEVCELNFELWNSEQNETTSGFCQKKFIYCCMNFPDGDKPERGHRRGGHRWSRNRGRYVIK